MPPCRVILPLLFVALLPVDAASQTRLVRRFAEDAGVVPPVWAVGQDRDGFLWIGAQGGLYRYDGQEIGRVGAERIRGGVISIAFHPVHGVGVVTERGEIFEVRAGTTTPSGVAGPPGPRRLRMLAYDRLGRLWTIRGSTLRFRDPGGAWHSVPDERIGGERPLMVRDDPRGAILVVTDAGVWRVAPDVAEKIIAAAQVVDVQGEADGVSALSGSVHLFRTGAGEESRHSLPHAAPALRGARPVALARRGATTWFAFDRFLVARRADGTLEVLSPEDAIEGGGPLFVDREGSLWVGTFTSLLQFPEPETRVWTERLGLPSRHTRFLARTGGTLWVSGWQGAARIATDSAAGSARPVTGWFTQRRLCVLPARGTAWTTSRRGYLELTADGVRAEHRAPGQLIACAPARDGGLWIAATNGLLRIGPAGGAPRPVHAAPPGDAREWQAVLEDSRGRLWVAREGRFCSRPLTEAAAVWRCRDTGATGEVTRLLELPGGALWASTKEAGVLRLGSAGWEPIPASLELPSPAILGMVPSPSGGAWILGHGVVQRVVPSGAGWLVVERMGSWNGLPVTGGQDLVEDADGTLWLTTSLGIVQVPPGARFAAATPPPVVLVTASIDDRTRSASELLALPFRQNRVELRFAALSFRDPARVRYQVRLGDDRGWRDVRGPPSFRWYGLRPGTYDVALRASLDGQHWSQAPAAARLRVLPPWYLEPWVLAAGALLAVLLVLAAYKVRVRMLLRLERQRTRIASDLHDEIGSGLGSIGILAGVLSASADGQRPEAARRQRLAREIAATSEQLGTALSDIVWALDPRAASLHELAARLTEHGNRLCAADDGPEFTADLPAAWPQNRLSAAARRAVLSIGLEALHNAVRHAGARHVSLALRPSGRRWELVIADDGTGIAPHRLNGASTGRDGGRGLPGMRRRAREIDAELLIRCDPAAGTRIGLRFALGSGPGVRRIFRSRRIA